MLLFLVFIVLPLAELFVILQVADLIGGLETIVLLIAVAVLGSWLLKREGPAAWARFRRALAEGRVPTDEITDGAFVMFGGALLLTPGFITDILGFVLLLPPTRAMVKAASRRRMSRWVQKRTGTRGVYDARVIRVDRATRTDQRPPGSAPSEGHPAALEDDSRGKG